MGMWGGAWKRLFAMSSFEVVSVSESLGFGGSAGLALEAWQFMVIFVMLLVLIHDE